MQDTSPQSESRKRNPVPPPHMLRPFVVGALLIILIGAGWGAYRLVMLNLAAQEAEMERALVLAENRAALSDALAQLPHVSAQNIANGFWYEYVDADGESHIFNFDLDREASRGMTDSEREGMIQLVADSRVVGGDGMRQLEQSELPPNLQFHNELYSFGTAGDNSLELKNALEAKAGGGGLTSDDLVQLAYLYELEGKYERRDELNTENCTRFAVRCGAALSITLEGRVVDDKGFPVAGATVEIVSRPGVSAVTTNENGTYVIKSSVMDMEKLRVRASKRNFSDGFGTTIVLSKGKRHYYIDDIHIESPIQIVTVDYMEKAVTGSGNSMDAAGNLVLVTDRSRYEIPAGAIVDGTGRPYTKGPIDVYLYEFTKGNPPESFMRSDTFDQVMGYAGDLMKTFGMPYIQFFTQDGVELDVLSSKPMRLTYEIADMEALRTNADKIYRPLTDADMELLVAASVGQPYRIDREFLINNRMLHFPAFWVFDRRRGVWDNVGITVLDVAGTIQTPFYTVRDL